MKMKYKIAYSFFTIFDDDDDDDDHDQTCKIYFIDIELEE